MKLDNANAVDTEASITKLKKQDGFTLIEVLIALTIFSVGLLAIAAMQTSAIRMNATAGHLTDLSNLGMDELERLLSLQFSDPLLTNGTHNDPAAPAGYTVNWTVAKDFPTTNTSSITLTVTGKGKSLILRCIKAQSL